MEKIKVLIADDQAGLRKTLKIELNKCEDIEVVGVVKSENELMFFCEGHKLDVIVIDIKMQMLSGLETLRVLKERYSNLKVLVLTTFSSDEYIQKFVDFKIDGYLLKGCDTNLILQAIKSVYRGINTLDQSIWYRIADAMLSNRNKESKEKRLTLVEKRVAELIVIGKYNKDIATEIEVSYGRVRNIVSSIYKKTGSKNREELRLLLKIEGTNLKEKR